MQMIGCLLSLLLIGFLLLLSMVGSAFMLLRQMLFGHKETSFGTQEQPQRDTASGASSGAASESSKKVFADDEGEYIPFEEIVDK